MATNLKFPLIESSEELTNDVIYIAPWKIFHHYPKSLSEHLHGNSGMVVPDGEVNMAINMTNTEDQMKGKLDTFCNMWVVKCETEEDLSEVLDKLERKYTVLHVLLIEQHVISNTIEIPMVLFVNNESRGIKSLKENLVTMKETGKHFSFEVDYGPVVEKWATRVLRRDFNCLGGRLCVTNGASFNHVLDWGNMFTCLPCLPCCLMAGSVYRVRRKLGYREAILNPITDIVLSGCSGSNDADQRKTLIQLMKWAKVQLMKTVKQNENGANDPDNNRRPSVLSVISLDDMEPLAQTHVRGDLGNQSTIEEQEEDTNADNQIELSTFATQINKPETVHVTGNRRPSQSNPSGLVTVDTDVDLLANRDMLSFLAPSYTRRPNKKRQSRSIHDDDVRSLNVKPGKTTSQKRKGGIEMEALTSDSTI